MFTEHIKALETRARWLKYARSGGDPAVPESPKVYYRYALQAGDNYFMDRKFCSLVDHARRISPDDFAFDIGWLQSVCGFMWIEQPFKIPMTDLTTKTWNAVRDRRAQRHESPPPEFSLSAIGWICHSSMERTDAGIIAPMAKSLSEATGVSLLFFLDFGYMVGIPSVDFGYWSYMAIAHGDKLKERVDKFEEETKTYVNDNHVREDLFSSKYINDPELHEIRWAYSAFYLMAQRLAVQVKHDTDRHTRRRNEREGTPVPDSIKVVTLRRLQEARVNEGASQSVEWNWQWEVRGHWRNQYFSSTKEHKPVFIEAYIKGPEGKPLKPPGQKIFVARR